MKIIGKEDKLEALQKNALKIAKDAANEFPDLDLMIAGNVANTCVYDPDDKSTVQECRKMFEEQVEILDMILKILANCILTKCFIIKKLRKFILYIIIEGIWALEISNEIVPDLAIAKVVLDNIFCFIFSSSKAAPKCTYIYDT